MLQDYDALGLRARADALIAQAGEELKAILKEMSRRADFPVFPGTPFQCVEAEPGRSQGRDYGCVVVCPDGELRELKIEMQGPAMPGGGALTRREDLREISLAPGDYIVYALSAIQELSKVIAGERFY